MTLLVSAVYAATGLWSGEFFLSGTAADFGIVVLLTGISVVGNLLGGNMTLLEQTRSLAAQADALEMNKLQEEKLTMELVKEEPRNV